MNVYNKVTDEFCTYDGTAVALGLFDGVHLGHRRVIDAALAHADSKHTVVFTFTTKEQRPVQKAMGRDILTVEGRLHCIADMGVQSVYLPDFSQIANLPPTDFVRDVLVEKLRAKVLCCGENFHFGANASGNILLLASLCKFYGIALTVVPAVLDAGQPISSTRIRSALIAGDIPVANRLLGDCYRITKPVAFGNKIGRSLGFPTINQPLDAELCLPRYGVYLSLVHLALETTPYPSITNIGVKPSIGKNNAPLAETHILQGSHMLYGQEVTVSLLRFLRPERTFASLDHLKRQIAVDKTLAEAYFD